MQAGNLTTDLRGCVLGAWGDKASLVLIPLGASMGPCRGSSEGLEQDELGSPKFRLQSSGCPGSAVPSARAYSFWCSALDPSGSLIPTQLGSVPRATQAQGWHQQGWPLWHIGTNSEEGARDKVSK